MKKSKKSEEFIKKLDNTISPGMRSLTPNFTLSKSQFEDLLSSAFEAGLNLGSALPYLRSNEYKKHLKKFVADQIKKLSKHRSR